MSERRIRFLKRLQTAWKKLPGTTWQDWRWQLRHSLAGPADARRLAGEPPAKQADWNTLVARYPFRTTPYYLALADPDDPRDPILRQVLPTFDEVDPSDDDPEDPFDERALEPVPGLIHRFPDRAVVLAAETCAVNCRHCTRKNTLNRPGKKAVRRRSLDDMVEAVRRRPGIREVIVSGGDPLMLDDPTLDSLLEKLRAIPHVRVLRLGTRAPVVLPMRITETTADRLARHRPLWVNTHFNHPREWTPEARDACERLVSRGIPVSNQTVLLKDVNDSAEILKTLFCLLQEHSVRPYYVFLCDPVRGTKAFRVPLERAVELAETLRTSLGGLALPRFVADVPGEPGKVPVERLTMKGTTVA